MALDLNDLKRRMEGAVQSFREDLAGLRTGRASPALLEPVQVHVYGGTSALSQVASVSAPEPRLLTVTVWDHSAASAVEKGIREANLGLNPIREGAVIRVPIPDLNDQRRAELIKAANGYAERARVAIRNVRRDGMDQLKKLEKDSVVTKDEVKTLSDKVQKLTDETIKLVDDAFATKEKEIKA